VVYKDNRRNCLGLLSDERLAETAASGDMESFEQLVNRHRMAVYRLARSITGNHDDADDAAQETFIRVYRALRSYDPERPFKAWLKRIAYNTSLNVLRASRVRLRDTADIGLAELANPSPGPEHELEASQTATGVESAVNSMPTELRATLLLRAVEGMSYRDIASATGVRIGTVMSRLSRARERIQQALEKAGVLGQRGEKI
jgi:RNA polymerase sigma-70 factor (ECF subfamily)